MKRFIALFLFLNSLSLSAQSVIINKNDAEVWGTDQIIKGRLNSFYAPSGTLHVNGQQINFNISAADSSFSVPIVIDEGTTSLYAVVENQNSDPVDLTLAYNIRPDVYTYAIVSGSDLLLKSHVIENPKNDLLFFSWSADPDNPSALSINNANDSSAYVSIPSGSPEGEYYFDLLITTGSNDTVKARTYVTLKNNQIKAFNIKTDYAAWIDSAVIYEISPKIFVLNGKFNHIKNKIPEFLRLGVNTLWLQPVYKTFRGGQGYDVIDYFSVRPDLGTEEDLRSLIETAKANGFKVMFDFVANHSSINHPYALNSTQYGTDSHYWDYYQREPDNAPYSQHYTHYQGFINYFWNDLPNLNFNNPEVRKWMTEAIVYWIEKFDIDGYRFDAIWGVTARNPQYTKDLRLALKRIKPELLLLAEDKASQPQVFDERFDLAFDWASEESWVSHWVWQTYYSTSTNPTIFNSASQNNRSAMLRNAITNYGAGYAPNAKILRFTGNNDLYYFFTHHGAERTRMAAALVFTLHGIPLLYNGEEIGSEGHPYNVEFIFYPGYPLDYDDPEHLFPYFQKLIRYRKTLPALYSNNYSEIPVSPSNYVFGFRRWSEDQNIFTILNMGNSPANVTITLPVNLLDLDTSSVYYLTDLVNGNVISGKPAELAQFIIPMDRYSAKILYLADSVYVVDVEAENNELIPDELQLNQNYPNPFNPLTIISFSIPKDGEVKLVVYDLLGSEIKTLVKDYRTAGRHDISFNASDLSSGIYFYRLTYNDVSAVKKMMVLK